MRFTIQIAPNDKIELDSDWGFPSGVKIGETRIMLTGPKVVANMLACLQDLQREYDIRDAGEDTEALSARELTRYTDADAFHDRQAEDRAMEDRAEAGI